MFCIGYKWWMIETMMIRSMVMIQYSDDGLNAFSRHSVLLGVMTAFSQWVQCRPVHYSTNGIQSAYHKHHGPLALNYYSAHAPITT